MEELITWKMSVSSILEELGEENRLLRLDDSGRSYNV